jgi:hypothetical protein
MQYRTNILLNLRSECDSITVLIFFGLVALTGMVSLNTGNVYGLTDEFNNTKPIKPLNHTLGTEVGDNNIVIMPMKELLELYN